MRTPLAIVLALVLASGCLGGADPLPQSQPPPEPKAEPERLDNALTLRARGYHEANLRLDANDSIAYRWNASHAISWDLHSHEGPAVKTWVQGKEMRAEGTFTAPVAGVYSLYFHHTEPYPIHVTYHVEGAFEVDSLSP